MTMWIQVCGNIKHMHRNKRKCEKTSHWILIKANEWISDYSFHLIWRQRQMKVLSSILKNEWLHYES